MTDALTISTARATEEARWARKGYRLVRHDGPRRMTPDELSEYKRTGCAPSTTELDQSNGSAY